MYVASKSDDPTFSSLDLGTWYLLGLWGLSVHLPGGHIFLSFPPTPRTPDVEMGPILFLGTLQSLLSGWDQKPGSQRNRVTVRDEGGMVIYRCEGSRRWTKGELSWEHLVLGGRSRWPGGKWRGKLRGERRTLHAQQEGMWKDPGQEMPGIEGWGDTTTDRELAVSDSSNAVIFLCTYCRNLGLYSKNLKLWGVHAPSSKLYIYRNSPVACGCRASHLDRKDVDAQHRRTVPGTSPSHIQPTLRPGTCPPPREGPSDCSLSPGSGIRRPLKAEKPHVTALPFTLKKDISEVLQPGPSSAVQFPSPYKHMPLLKIVQTLHKVAGAAETHTGKRRPG